MAKEEQQSLFNPKKYGRRIKTISPYTAISALAMKERSDSLNYFQDSIEITEIEKFLRKKRDEGLKGIGFLQLFIAAYVRTISQFPQLNRYIQGQAQYAAREIIVVMTVKKEMSEDGQDTSIKVRFDPHDTLEDVHRKMTTAINDVKGDSQNSTDDTAAILTKIPLFLRRWIMSILSFLDFHGWLPKVIVEASPFHGSMIITDMGSLGIPPIFHHIYNFGNLPIFISFGAKRRVHEVTKTGEVVQRRYIDYDIVMDERITDGYTYAQALKMMCRFVSHPEYLEVPPDVVKQDIP